MSSAHAAYCSLSPPMGSFRPQSSRCAHGSAGQATPQPIVTSQSTCLGSSDRCMGRSAAMASAGIPRRESSSRAPASTWGAGSVPAERNVASPDIMCSASAWAIWLRQALCVQTKATTGRGAPAATTAVPDLLELVSLAMAFSRAAIVSISLPSPPQAASSPTRSAAQWRAQALRSSRQRARSARAPAQAGGCPRAHASHLPAATPRCSWQEDRPGTRSQRAGA